MRIQQRITRELYVFAAVHIRLSWRSTCLVIDNAVRITIGVDAIDAPVQRDIGILQRGFTVLLGRMDEPALLLLDLPVDIRGYVLQPAVPMNQRGNGPLLLLACLPGELHEIGLLFFALAAVNAGYRVLILGANTPLQQIPGVLDIKPCVGVILSGSAKPARRVIETDLPDLTDQLTIPVFIGGEIAVSYQEKLEQAGIICLGENIATGLQLANKRLKPNKSH